MITALRGSALGQAIADTQVRWTRVTLAVGAGSVALGSAVGLAATAAWLIARASEMPSPADVALAAVIVRFFGVARGLFRYLERLLSHHTALSGMVALRERSYADVAARDPQTTLTASRGDVIARLGPDLDAVGDAVVKAIIPAGIAVTVSLGAVVITAIQHPGAGVALAVFLVIAGVVPGFLTLRSARLASQLTTEAQARVTVAALSAIEHSSDHLVWDRTDAVRGELRDADADLARAADQAARPVAWAAAVAALSQGLAVIVAVILGVVAVRTGDISGPAGAMVALLPLAAFEAVSAVPGAVQQWTRSSLGAQRLAALRGQGTVTAPPEPAPASCPSLTLSAVQAARPGMRPTPPITAHLAPGSELAIVGRSGVGKTTLLHVIAGALPPHAGTVQLNGHTAGPHHTGTWVALTTEDAHVFGTSIAENLRVARGDADEALMWDALEVVGLDAWVRSLPAGLDTVVGSGGQSVSGGQRRRLLLARALIHPAPIHLIDEPGEHLDDAGVAAVRAAMTRMRATGRTVVVVTHDHRVARACDQVVSLDH